jgi:hypothetical protein
VLVRSACAGWDSAHGQDWVGPVGSGTNEWRVRAAARRFSKDSTVVRILTLQRYVNSVM